MLGQRTSTGISKALVIGESFLVQSIFIVVKVTGTAVPMVKSNIDESDEFT